MQRLIRRFFAPEGLVRPDRRRGVLPSFREAYGEVAQIAIPAIAEMVLMSLIASADTIMVGQLGKNALAAVSLPSQPRMLMLSMFFALNVGVTAIVARRKGQGLQNEANETLRSALVMGLGLSMVIMALSLWLAEPVLRLAGGNTKTADDAEVLRGATNYFRIMMLALPINAVSMSINAALRGAGNTRITMQVNITSNLINVVFNFLLIFGHLGFPALGIEGAAIASVIGMAAGAVLSLMAVFRHQGSFLTLSFKQKWLPTKQAVTGILRVGGNAMVEQIAVRIGFFLFSRIMYDLGVTMFAANNIAMQFLGLTFNFADGVSAAATSLVGQNLGKERPDLAFLYGRIGQRISVGLALVIAGLTVAFRYPLSALFINQATPQADKVIEYAAQAMLVVALMQPFQMPAVVLSGALRGAGDNLYVASRMMICVTILRPVLALFAVHVLHLGLALTWLISLSEIAVRLVFFHSRFQSGKWQLIRV